MFRPQRVVRFCLLGALLLIMAARASFAEKPSAWSRMRSPNFIVVTNASEKQARRVAYQFEMIRAVLRQFFNRRGSTTDPPVIIIAAKDEATFRTLLPEIYLGKGSTQLAGLYVGGPEKNYVALRLDVSLNRDTDEPFEPVYHEYVHYFMRRVMSQIPLWLTEGLAEFYGNTRLEGKYVLVGAPSSSNLTVLRQFQLLPLSTLFAVNASSPYYHENNKASIFYAESWALTHYLMVQDWRSKTDHLNQFVALLGENRAAEDAAKRTIGDPQALEKALGGYVGMFAFTTARLPAPPEVNEDAFAPEPISEAESLAVRADFLVHNRRYAEAKQMLAEALKIDPKLASAYESMGQLYAQQNQTEEANKWYSQAVALNSQSCLANFYYATNLLKGRMDDDLAAKAEASLRAAIRIDAQFAPAYDALAYLLASRRRGLEEARMLALQAITLEPGNVHYRLRMVQVLEEMNHADDALRVATLAASMAKTPQEWAEAQSALDSARHLQDYQRRAQERQEALQKTPAEADEDAESMPAREAPAPGEHAAPEEIRPPVLQHRGGETGSGVLVPDTQASAPPPRPELLPGRAEVDGKIIDSRCTNSITLDLTIVSPAGISRLFSDNYYKIPFSALNFTPQGVLNPCTDLQGKHAHVTYHPAKDHLEQGEIMEVQLAK
jgi:tetratricopeptide (TPR) repeat protein